MTWLWFQHSFGEWIAAMVVHTIIQFVLIAALLTPLWGRLRAVFEEQINPWTPGGAGDVHAPDGTPMHEYLQRKEAE